MQLSRSWRRPAVLTAWPLAAALGGVLACSATGGTRLLGGGGAGGDAGSGGGTGGAQGGNAGDAPGGKPMVDVTFPDASVPVDPNKDGTKDPTVVCGKKEFQPVRLPPEVMLVLDRSGSMRRSARGEDPKSFMAGETDKWTQAISALDTAIQATQQGIFWGLKQFPMPPITVATDPRKCQGDTTPAVAPAIGNHDMVLNTAKANAPVLDVGATPTAAAVLSTLSFLKARTTPNPKAMVLATDGVPNCKNNDDSQGDVDGAVAAIKQAADAKIPVYVVGLAVSGGEGEAQLNMMAVAGGVARTGTPAYYAANDATEFTAQLNSIAGQVATCTYPLDEPPVSPPDVTVDVGATRLKRLESGTTGGDGWLWGPDMKTIELRGQACDAAKMEGTGGVKITFGCPPVVVQ